MKSLQKNTEFKKVYQKGKSFACHSLVIYYRKNDEQETRVGYSISKKIGKAVTRNRMKRRLREIIRNLPIKAGYDIIILVRKKMNELGFKEMKRDVRYVCKKTSLLDRNSSKNNP